MLLKIVLIILLIGLLPTWPYSVGWGFLPSGLVGFLLLIVLVRVVTRGGKLWDSGVTLSSGTSALTYGSKIASTEMLLQRVR